MAGSTTNTALPTGWLLNETGGGARDNEQYAVDTGGSTTGDTYSYGAAGSTERAFGSLRSGTLIPTFGACFTNNTGGMINSFDIAYTGEQWRLGTAGRTDTLAFQFSTNATDLTIGTWTGVAALDFVTPNTATTGAKNGNDAANRTARSATVSGVSIANGANFCIRWNDLDASGADDGLAIDDFSITAGAAAPAPDFSVTLAATPTTVGVGETFELRARYSNVGTVDLAAPVASTYTIPTGLVRTSQTFENISGGAGGSCSTSGLDVTIMSCSLVIPAGASIDWVTVYRVEAGAVSPLQLQVTGTPPPADGNPANNSASTTVQIVQVLGIHDIQGTGVGSPLAVGTNVVTEGIVTALRSNGYFIQSAPADVDADPATAEGVFVFTSAAPPAEAVVGNRLRVAGRVNEFSRTPHGFPLTQLGSATATVLSTGNPLPPAVVLDASVLAPNVGIDALGRYQGMRVQLPQAVVVGPTNGFGDFHVTLPGVPRPAREPGVAVLDAVPLPPGKSIPLFDKNPERLRVESTGLVGGTARDFDAGTTLQGMEGVMYYDRGDFTLLIGDSSGVIASGGAFVSAVPVPAAGSVRIGSYNIQNLSGGASVPLDRLSKLSEVFCQYLRLPDVVGLVEIADLATAQRLAQAINTDEFGFCPQNPEYVAYLLSNNGSQRLAYLVKTAPVAPGQPRVEVLDVVEHFADQLLVAPDNSTSPTLRLFDRPPLQLDAVVHEANGRSFPLTVILNHTLSLLDVNDLTANATYGTLGNRSREKRRQQAERVSQLVEGIAQADATQPVVLIGDYNAFEFSDGYVDVMGIISGEPAPTDEVLVPGTSAVTTPLVNLLKTVPVEQQYSYVFEGNTQSIDHALVNQAAMDATIPQLHHARVNADFASDLAADPTVPVRSSDHDPLVAELVVPEFIDADVAVQVFAPFGTVREGNTATFRAAVTNAGNGPAYDVSVDFTVDAAPDQLMRVTASGWECSTPESVDGDTRFTCTRVQALAPAQADLIKLELIARRVGAIGVLGVEAEASTRSNDLQPANDADGASVPVLGRPNWSGGRF
ncbi:MAG: hypothetical protein ABS41_03675 [Arenimonas sp. SCN 70-307]|nr:MAG: hypothetical protein ABS41_03675 [Arenimonas sp. SCN 70-307]